MLCKEVNTKEVDKLFLDKLIPNFTKDCIVNIGKEDLLRLGKGAKEIYYSEYIANDKCRAFRIRERIKCNIAEFGSDNKAALYITGDPTMDELAEILDGLNVKVKEIIWGSCNKSDVGVDVIKVAMLFYVL